MTRPLTTICETRGAFGTPDHTVGRSATSRVGAHADPEHLFHLGPLPGGTFHAWLREPASRWR